MDDQRNAAGPLQRARMRAESQHPPVNGRTKRAGTVKEQRWPGTVMAIALFISLYVVLWLGRRTLVETVTLVRALALFCAVGALLPYAWSGLRMGMEKLEWFLFNVLAIGPLTLSLLLLVNHFIHGPVRYADAVIGYDVKIGIDGPDGPREVALPGRGYFYFGEDELASSTSRRYRVGVAKGCLGYWSVTYAEVLP